MSKYLISLTPVDKFFFGGEMTFPIEGKKDYNKKFSSYIIRSSYFPQQTSLLGMMRFLLLRNSECFKNGAICNADNAVELIGPTSFNPDESDYGKIKHIGHCFILDKESKAHYNWAPFDSGLNISFKSDEEDAYTNKTKLHIPDFEKTNYNAKNGYEHCLESVVGSDRVIVPVKEFFLEDRRVGINRDIHTGKAEDDAFFKQISFKFSKRSYAFAFYTEVDTDILSYNNQIVSLGADNSQFSISIEEVDTYGSVSNNEECKVTLLSPTRIEFCKMENVKFCITELTNLRYLQTSVRETKSYSLLKGNVKRNNMRIEMYSPGSVFYFENKELAKQFKEAIESYKGYIKIGFNEYK